MSATPATPATPEEAARAHRQVASLDAPLFAALEQALASLAQAASATPLPASAPVIVALSGGPDSSVLLDLACRLRDRGTPVLRDLRAVHVHHGLQPAADDWVAHCERFCAERSVELLVERVKVDTSRGIEAGAREARYGALARVGARLRARFVLTAHHQDDRIETFLLQWMRGAGPAGLAGIAGERTLAPGLPLLRPLLDMARADLAAYRARHALECVEDPSNADLALARNALRRRVLPELARIRSGFGRAAARSIELVAEAAELVRELSQSDLAHCREDAPAGMLRLDRLATLAPARQTATLRAWLQDAGLQAPPRSRLTQILAQALGAGGSSRMLVHVGGTELRRYRGLLVLRGRARSERSHEVLHWRGEPALAVPAWGGVLRFEPAGAQPGLDPEWLRARPLELRMRSGGERFRPQAGRPSRRLKQLFQEAGIPEFERAHLPLVWRDGHLLFVPGLGIASEALAGGAGRLRLQWVGEGELSPG